MCDKRLGYAFLLSFAAHVLDATTAACNKPDADAELTSLLQGRLHVEKPDFKNLESTNVPIDFVYCWAGETKRGPTNEVGGGSAEDHNIGYSFNEMQYSIRSLQVFVPWFNKVYLLVNGQAKLPAWAVGDSRIVMVDRCTLFPEKRDCPTMNSAACEAVMHRIPGLHEKFVMMQDDWFLLRKMSPSDFFSTSGRPRYAPPVTKDSLVEMYGPRKYLHGPHMPPEHVPDRLDSWSFTHRAMPMTVSFNMQLEKKFPDWFAFVRSHKTRFVCCNASIFGNGLDEEFLRVYPAMLYKLDAGDQLPKYSLKTAALHGTACNCENKECIKEPLGKVGRHCNPKLYSTRLAFCEQPLRQGHGELQSCRCTPCEPFGDGYGNRRSDWCTPCDSGQHLRCRRRACFVCMLGDIIGVVLAELCAVSVPRSHYIPTSCTPAELHCFWRRSRIRDAACRHHWVLPHICHNLDIRREMRSLILDVPWQN